MNETVNQDNNTEAKAEERTFTQAEMNAIVQDRLTRERAKYADFDTYKEKAEKFDAAEEASKSELQKATERANSLQEQLDKLTHSNEVRGIREKVATETGVPVTLLSAENEEDCKKQAEAILAFAKPSGYPSVRDSGEVTKTSTTSTRDQFAEWLGHELTK